MPVGRGLPLPRRVPGRMRDGVCDDDADRDADRDSYFHANLLRE
jgi:hypothetical protein